MPAALRSGALSGAVSRRRANSTRARAIDALRLPCGRALDENSIESISGLSGAGVRGSADNEPHPTGGRVPLRVSSRSPIFHSRLVIGETSIRAGFRCAFSLCTRSSSLFSAADDSPPKSSSFFYCPVARLGAFDFRFIRLIEFSFGACGSKFSRQGYRRRQETLGFFSVAMVQFRQPRTVRSCPSFRPS